MKRFTLTSREIDCSGNDMILNNDKRKKFSYVIKYIKNRKNIISLRDKFWNIYWWKYILLCSLSYAGGDRGEIFDEKLY